MGGGVYVWFCTVWMCEVYVITLWTGDADFRLYITTVQDG